MTIFKNKNFNIIGGIVAIVLVSLGIYFFTGNDIDITNDPTAIKEKGPSSLTGIVCENYNSRPFAVMISSDAEARPLSGIGEADIVFEMPVVENGFTRMMAVFQCGRPSEIGSVRSSRLDFVPLALGINAIYAHFGGERTVLEELNGGVINNIDGLKYDGTVYYRKKNIPMPHNAFTDIKSLIEISEDLGYNMIDSKVSYLHEEESKSLGNIDPIPVFNEGFKAEWKYNANTNSYFRNRSNKPEIDKNSGKQVESKNVVIMKTTWSPIDKDYIRIKTVGTGGSLVYRDGTVITGTWEKKNNNSKLYFYDQNHKEILFAPGAIWVEITTAQ